MSTTTIRFMFWVDGAIANATAVALRDPANSFGVRRTDTSATIVAAGAAMTHSGLGCYEYSFVDPTPGLVYNYWVEVAYDGATYRFERNQSAAPATDAPGSYLTVDEANQIAAAFPALANWPAASSDVKARSLAQATDEVDHAMPYQGRRFDFAQAMEFPRIAYDDFAHFGQPAGPAVVWDTNSADGVPVVPLDVRRAVLCQADAIIGGTRNTRLDAQHDGVVYELANADAESYKSSAGPGVQTGLCRAAFALLKQYRLKSGRLA